MPWLRFAHAVELGSICRGVTDCRGFVSRTRSNWVRFVASLQIAVASFRSRGRIGFDSSWRYGWRWLRFVGSALRERVAEALSIEPCRIVKDREGTGARILESILSKLDRLLSTHRVARAMSFGSGSPRLAGTLLGIELKRGAVRIGGKSVWVRSGFPPWRAGRRGVRGCRSGRRRARPSESRAASGV